MVLAPFSEINGRRPVFIATGVLFVICQLCCAITRSFGGMLAARFFAGVGGSTFSTMVGGVISDIYHKEDRNAPMALFSGKHTLKTQFLSITFSLDQKSSKVFRILILFLFLLSQRMLAALTCDLTQGPRCSVRGLVHWYRAS